ncbi:ComEC/Rec2 family competence protein [Donghicola tyrosinivorans]|uniref:Competence protein ComEC n=1 Tax=Donghicola tyrosinivorans TaxID=1652492 RepID=A0A2T0X5B6_9RHOB|nr:ComEC/Rec2 family competence protein [Donghicola tyrosinivorans]PRY94162.1 competence protein ComEC [Donghicola tyrosinivorans]
MRVLAWINNEWLEQRGHLFPWAAVCFGLGCGAYFLPRAEPAIWLLWACLGLGLAGLCAARFGGLYMGPLLVGLACVLLGFGSAGWRTHRVAAPVMQGHYYGPIEGRIVDMDRSGSGALRLLLDQVVLDAAIQPIRVRVSLHGRQDWLTPAYGQVVMMTGHLSPPSGAVEPGGFDFRRHAWFRQIGGIGYTRTPALLLGPAPDRLGVGRVRSLLSQRLRAAMPDVSGGVAAALLAGDRAYLPAEVVQNLRDSNLAHLLAISGLHMGLLAGLVFAAVRFGLAAMPWVALHWPIKKLAAVVALVGGAGYLALSGGSIATQRAYVMVAVALLALLFDRKAFSLRSVALAAMVVLALAPEAVTGPGFQMSFAATTALIAAFGVLPKGQRIGWRKWLFACLTVVFSSAVAGLATAPFAAAHFNRITDYGLLANLLATPLMGTVVIPAGLAGVCLMPFGLEALPLWVMGQGIAWILWVADFVAGLEGAVTPVVAPSPSVLPLIAAGGLWVCVIKGRLRFAAVLPLFVAIGLWSQTQRPELLISDDGKLVGVQTPEGRALSFPKGAGFVAEVWLENDGDMATQAEAASRPLWQAVADGVGIAQFGTTTLLHLRGKRGVAYRFDCSEEIWVISDQFLGEHLDVVAPNAACRVFDRRSLFKTGAVAARASDSRPEFASDRTGGRLWARAR